VRKKPVRKLLVACITGALFLPKLGFTLGLGDIEVNSALNQELKAEIELFSAAPEDAETLIVKLASRDAFSRAGLDRPFLLNELRFKTVVVDNVPHIQITTATPVREPFLNFLLEVDWPKGHLLREYTVLLDPPTFMLQSQAPSHQAPSQSSSQNNNQNTDFRPSAAPAAAVVNPAPTSNFRPAARPVTAASPKNNTVAVTPSAVRNQAADRYRIQSGDTAWSLAESMRPNSSITVEQMMMALLHANPESFINENINGLKRGYILRSPDLADITAISPAQARAMVKEQAALWRQYQQSYSGGSLVSAIDNYENGSAAGSQTSSAENAASKDRSSQDKGAHLQIVSAGDGASTSGVKDPTAMSSAELREALALARENLETERVEKELLHEEIAQLEHQLGQSKGLMTLEGGELASAQSVKADDISSNATDEMAADEVVDDASATELPADAGSEELGEEVAAATDGDVDSAGEAIFVDETDEGNLTEDEAMTSETSASDSSPVDDAVEPAPVGIVNNEPVDPLTRLMNDPMLLAAAGGGLLLILALGYLIVKRRKSATDDAESDETSGTTSLDDIADMVEEDQQEDAEVLDTESTMIMEAVDTNVDTVITDAFDEEEAFDEIVEEEEEARDDVIAEADVYLAYGIYQQAEDLLENAISENPDRDDYRVKLAETRYASKDEAGFIEAATELRQRHPDEDTAAWKKVAAMGVTLCPDNALFQGGAAADVDVDALAPQSPEPMDIDLGLDEDLNEDLDIPDLDLSLGEADSIEASDDGNDAILDIGDADDVFDVGSDDTNEEVDLDSDEVEFDLSETDAVAEESVAEEISEEEFSLDIDASELDIDDDNDGSEDASLSDEVAEESTETDDTDENIEIDIDSAELDLDVDFGAEDASEEVSTEEVSADSLDIDFAADADEKKTSDDSAMEDGLEIDISDDADSLDIDFGVDDATASDASEDTGSTAEEDSVELDIGESDDDENAIDLDVVDLDTSDNDLAEESGDAESEDALDDAMDDDEFDLSSLDDVDEISTKLDLARAYLDMGDSEGTREILKEVLVDGSNEQKKEAEELMGQLDD